ncbi:MAG: glycerol-3-phosphate cytidylyltransferase [Bermanella sp.]|jgi:glycerol-3-phosphate cytidylyltransferase
MAVNFYKNEVGKGATAKSNLTRDRNNTMIVYTVGTFDLLHVGHLALLEYCATLGDVLAVGVASDRVVNSYKPNVPVIPLDQRVEMLKALRCVDIVRSYDELEYVSGCKELEADIFVVGEDWGKNPHNIAVESYLKSEGKEIIQVLYNPRTSSSRIKQNTIAQSQTKKYIERAAA